MGKVVLEPVSFNVEDMSVGARRTLMQFRDVPLRTRRVHIRDKVYGDNALHGSHGTLSNSINARLSSG